MGKATKLNGIFRLVENMSLNAFRCGVHLSSF